MCLNPIFNSLGCTPKVAWVDHVVNVFFIFEEPPYCIHSCCPILHSYSQSEGFTSSIWGRGKHSPEKHMTCSRVPECLQNQGSIQSFLALWMLALNQNVKLGLWSIRGGSPPHITGGHWVSLALQSCVGRRHFMPQSIRKHSPVISDSEWRLVPPPSRQLGGHGSLMLWLSWARVCASPQMSSHSAAEQSSYSTSLFKQWNRKCPGFRILGEEKCRVGALCSASP